MQVTLSLLLFFVFAYLLGSIPFSLVIARFRGVDLLKTGSGNLGATNVYRSLGLPTAVFVFFLDALKGFIPTQMALTQAAPYILHGTTILPSMGEQPLLHVLVGGLAILGHTFSPFVKFKGGKGVATGLGVILALSPQVFGILFTLGVTAILITRYVSPVSIVSSILLPFLIWGFGYPKEYWIFTGIVGIYIVYKHRANIVRLLNGTENKI
jgi:acyl phosphate:glycerol-3-phosphate acyltransferase